MTERKAISILGTYEFCGFNHTEAKFFATPEDWQEALAMAITALYEKLNHEILNRTESDTVKVVDSDQFKNEPLTMDELRQMHEATPVWLQNSDSTGFWCLSQTGVVMMPSGRCYDISEFEGKLYRYELVKRGKLARNLHDVASNEQVTEPLQRNGYSGSVEPLATKNQVKNDWICINDRLPEPFVSVLVYMPGERPLPTVHEGYIATDGKWYAHFFSRDPGEVTHWMPMPEAPEVEV